MLFHLIIASSLVVIQNFAEFRTGCYYAGTTEDRIQSSCLASGIPGDIHAAQFLGCNNWLVIPKDGIFVVAYIVYNHTYLALSVLVDGFATDSVLCYRDSDHGFFASHVLHALWTCPSDSTV